MTEIAMPGGGSAVVFGQGGKAIVEIPLTNPGSITASGTLTVPAQQTGGLEHIVVAAQINQAGTLSVQRYIDKAATIAQGAALTAAMTANTLAVVDNNDGKLVQSASVNIINGSTSNATIATLFMALGAP